MEKNMNFMVPSPVPTNLPIEIITSPVIDEGPRVCPLCSSEARFFFINFNEKMLMCENTECDFPFGYENLQFLKVDTDESVSDVLSSKTKAPRSPCSNSMISTSAWSEIDKMNRVYESEDSTLTEARQLTPVPVKTKSKKSTIKKTETQIKKNVEDIKGLNMELLEIETPKSILLNEKWINNLKTLQDQSGIKLLKPQELKRVQQEKQEIKIDIATDKTNNMSSINIQLASTSNA